MALGSEKAEKDSSSIVAKSGPASNPEPKKKGNNKKQRNGKDKETTPPPAKEPLVNGHNAAVNGMNGHASEGEQQKDKTAADDKKKSESEVMEIIQDTGFTVQILSPGVEALSIQVSSMELVQEIHQLLMDREDTCHRTCFAHRVGLFYNLNHRTLLQTFDVLQLGKVIQSDPI